jgi:hypothetical protein
MQIFLAVVLFSMALTAPSVVAAQNQPINKDCVLDICVGDSAAIFAENAPKAIKSKVLTASKNWKTLYCEEPNKTVLTFNKSGGGTPSITVRLGPDHSYQGKSVLEYFRVTQVDANFKTSLSSAEIGRMKEELEHRLGAIETGYVPGGLGYTLQSKTVRVRIDQSGVVVVGLKYIGAMHNGNYGSLLRSQPGCEKKVPKI